MVIDRAGWLWLSSLLTLLFGIVVIYQAPSITQQIAGLLLVLIAAVDFAAALIVSTLLDIRRDIQAGLATLKPPPAPKPASAPARAATAPIPTRGAGGEWDITR